MGVCLDYENFTQALATQYRDKCKVTKCTEKLIAKQCYTSISSNVTLMDKGQSCSNTVLR